MFDGDNRLLLPIDGATVRFNSTPEGYPLQAILGKRLPHARTIEPIPGAVAMASSTSTGESAMRYQSLWHRLGFPFERQWQQAARASTGAFPCDVDGNPLQVPGMDKLADSPRAQAVLQGRMHALPLFTHSRDQEKLGGPGDTVYMDGCGPMIKSVVTQHNNYL